MSDRGMDPKTRKAVMLLFAIVGLILLPVTLFATAYFIQHPMVMNEGFLPETWKYPFIAITGIAGVILGVMALTNRSSKYVSWMIVGASVLLTLALSGWVWWFGVLPAVYGISLLNQDNKKFYAKLALVQDNTARGSSMQARNIAVFLISLVGGSVLLNYLMDNYEWAHKLRIVMFIVFGIVMFGITQVFPPTE